METQSFRAGRPDSGGECRDGRADGGETQGQSPESGDPGDDRGDVEQ